MTPSTTNFPLSTIPTINFYPTLDMEEKKNTTKCTKRNRKKNEIKRNKRKRSHNYFAYLVIIVIKKKKNDRVKSLHTIGHHRLACTCAINQKQLAD